MLAFAAAMGASDSAFMVPFLQSCGCCDHIIAILEGETVLSEVVAILVFRTVVELQINVVLSEVVCVVARVVVVVCVVVVVVSVAAVVAAVVTVPNDRNVRSYFFA